MDTLTTLPKYSEQFNLITEAYIKDEIQPMSPAFCICGTLAKGKGWCGMFIEPDGLCYTPEDFFRIEKALLTPLIPFGAEACYSIGQREPGNWLGILKDRKKGYEGALFKGMCKAIDELKQIHIEHGEVIDEVPMFTKRELTTTNS